MAAIKRHYIWSQMLSRIGSPNSVSSMKDDDLEFMLSLYDRLFFGGNLLPANGKLRVQFGQFGEKGQFGPFGEQGERTDSTGISGHTFVMNGVPTMLISRPVFSKLFRDCNQTEVVNGVQCRDQLECLMLSFEHELVHVLLNMWAHELFTEGRGHGEHFQRIAQYYFGHTDVKHWLGRCLGFDPDEYRERVIESVRPGDQVRIYDHEDGTRDVHRVDSIGERVYATNLRTGVQNDYGLIDVILSQSN